MTARQAVRIALVCGDSGCRKTGRFACHDCTDLRCARHIFPIWIWKNGCYKVRVCRECLMARIQRVSAA